MIKRLFYTLIFVSFVKILFAQDTLTNEEKNYQLLTVSYSGKVDSVVYWLNHGADVNARSTDGITPLIYAVQSGNLDAVKALVYNGADVNFHDAFCIPPLFMAIAQNQPFVVEFLLHYGANGEQLINNNVSALQYAVKYADTTIINDILTFKDLINKTDEDGNSPLMYAVYFMRYDAIYFLCMNNANTEIQDSHGLTPFLLSIQLGDTMAANMLLQCGSMRSERSNNKYGMLEYALISKKDVMIDWALKQDTIKELNASLLKLAYALDNRNLVKKIKNYGAKPYFGCVWQSFHIGFSEVFNQNDMMWGPTLTIHEAHYGINISAMYYTRFWANRIFSEIGYLTYLQLWERRSLWGLSVTKTIKLYKKDYNSIMLALGVNEYITYGHYRGVHLTAPHYFFTSPVIEIWDKYSWGSLVISSEYYKFKDIDSSPLRFKFSCFVNIPLKGASYLNKQIN